MRYLLVLTIMAMLFTPFGQAVQAETGKTVNDMFNTPENKNVNEQVEIEQDQNQNKPETNNGNQSEQETTETDIPEFESQFSWFDFVKMFFALGIVIALIYIILRFINKKNQLFGQMRAMENLGGLSLGTNRSIQLVRIGERIFVVGVGESIQLLKEITSPEEIEQLTNKTQTQPLDISQTILNKWLPSKGQQNESKGTQMDFRNLLKDQLSELSEGRKKIYEKFKKDQDE
ncbi:flagellar biosynthetic protein FliO [Bacillus sp. Marseille-P3661]|uniref:flagellar biosynthetic protein FliO n=1 Tax=Bacillus sp. Marseille-P3661 TaxID=1936234 RepID=UPI000C864D12|nr:flagellar biosynthetic protein FliO [Bacillus sp. Marseille-P3661]